MDHELIPTIRKVLIGLGLFKIAYFLVLLAGIFSSSEFYDERASIIRQYWFEAEWMGERRGELEKHFATWDAEHYLYLSEFGYSKDLRSCAFYPLWPLSIQFGSWLAGGSQWVTGIILANLFSGVGWCLFFLNVLNRFGRDMAISSLLILLVFPGSLFFQFVYSESLFFLLMMGLWWGLEHQRYGIALVAALLLPLTRGVGAFAVIPLAWHWIGFLPDSMSPRWKWLVRERRGNGVNEQSRFDRRMVWRTILVLVPAGGWACYLFLMWLWTGNPLEGMQAQRHWAHTHSVKNLVDFPRFVAGFFDVTAFHALRGSMVDRIGFLVMLMCLPAIWKHGKDLVAWTFMLGLVPAMSGTFTSFIRFEAMVFPMFIALGAVFSDTPFVKLRWGCLVGLGLMHLYLVWRFVNYYWAG